MGKTASLDRKAQSKSQKEKAQAHMTQADRNSILHNSIHVHVAQTMKQVARHMLI